MGLCVLYYVKYSLYNVKKVGFFYLGWNFTLNLCDWQRHSLQNKTILDQGKSQIESREVSQDESELVENIRKGQKKQMFNLTWGISLLRYMVENSMLVKSLKNMKGCLK